MDLLAFCMSSLENICSDPQLIFLYTLCVCVSVGFLPLYFLIERLSLYKIFLCSAKQGLCHKFFNWVFFSLFDVELYELQPHSLCESLTYLECVRMLAVLCILELQEFPLNIYEDFGFLCVFLLVYSSLFSSDP